LWQEKVEQLKHALHQSERPLRLATDCQLFREARMDIDLVKDEVENCLDREIEVIRYNKHS
jgi:hypothetical protein